MKILLGLTLFLSSTFAVDFVCEKFQKVKLQRTDEVFTCFMGIVQENKPKTRFPITHYRNSRGLNLQGNKNIVALPKNISKVMFNLVNYDGTSCAVTTISKVNFVNLRNLKRVWLSHNEIETVNSDTFEDCAMLIEIALDHNKLKIMSGLVFQNLRSLQKVSLASNPCIGEDFHIPSKIQELVQTVSNFCSTCGARADTTELADCQSNLSIISDKLQKCKVDKETQVTTPSSTFVDFCKVQLSSQNQTFVHVFNLQKDTIEELRREKLALNTQNEKQRQEIKHLITKNARLSGNCEEQSSIAQGPTNVDTTDADYAVFVA